MGQVERAEDSRRFDEKSMWAPHRNRWYNKNMALRNGTTPGVPG